MFWALVHLSQTVITVKDGNTNGDLPIDPSSGYSYSQQIYLQSEIDNPGEIYSIWIEYNGYSQGSKQNWDIYMGHTTKSTFSSGSDWVAIGGMTQVYSDQLQTTAGSNFFEIVLDPNQRLLEGPH